MFQLSVTVLYKKKQIQNLPSDELLDAHLLSASKSILKRVSKKTQRNSATKASKS